MVRNIYDYKITTIMFRDKSKWTIEKINFRNNHHIHGRKATN